MSERDIAVQTQYNVPSGSTTLTKPCYLIRFAHVRSQHEFYFISLDLPEMGASMIKAKGVWIEIPEKIINDTDKRKFEKKLVENYTSIVKDKIADKKNIVEMYLPIHTVLDVKNLAFNADKSGKI